MRMLPTCAGVPMSVRLFNNYMQTMVNLFFKILPLWESEEKSLPTYLKSLQVEMLGSGALVETLQFDSQYVSLLAILQYLIDHPDCEVKAVKREVFRAISICNKMKAKYATLLESEV